MVLGCVPALDDGEPSPAADSAISSAGPAAPGLPERAADGGPALDHVADVDARTAQVAAPVPDGAAPAPLLDERAYLRRPVPVLAFTIGQPLPRWSATMPPPKVPGTLRVIEEHDGSSLSGIERRPASLEVNIRIKIRGNSSAYFYEQKPYGFEIVDERGEDLRVPLLGLPREADFVLSSCFSDKSCLRNALAYEIGRALAAPSGRFWAPRTRFVEVIVDGRYQGLYLLAEKIEASKTRLALPRPAPDAATGDLSGGYVFSGEGSQGKGPGRDWTDPVRRGFKWTYRFPDADEITPAQKAYLQGAVTALGNLLVSDPRWRETYASRMDVPSWVDFFLVNELSNNVDGFWKSFYVYRTPDAAGGKFHAGPLWDFDLAFGNVNYVRRYCTNVSQREGMAAPWSRLFEDPAFVERVRCRWLELRRPGGPLDVAWIEQTIDAFVGHVERAKARDQERWKTIGRWVWPNNYVGASYADEVRYLKYWLRRRIAWLDRNVRGACPGRPDPPRVEPLPMPPTVNETAPRPVLIPTLKQAPAYVPVDGPTSDPRLAEFSCPGS